MGILEGLVIERAMFDALFGLGNGALDVVEQGGQLDLQRRRWFETQDPLPHIERMPEISARKRLRDVVERAMGRANATEREGIRGAVRPLEGPLASRQNGDRVA